MEASISFETSMNFYQLKGTTSQNKAFFKSSSVFALKEAVCAGSIHMHKSEDEVSVIARMKFINCVLTLFLSTEDMDRICNCNISGLDVLEKEKHPVMLESLLLISAIQSVAFLNPAL